jgi:hypothetical protein
LRRGDQEACYRLGRRLSDGLRLIVDGGLGWQKRTADPTVLTMPEDELLPIISRMKSEATAAYEALRADHEASAAPWREIAVVRDACGSLLDQIGSQ